MLENDSMFKDGKVHVVTNYDFEENRLTILFHGVSENLLSSIKKKFKFKIFALMDVKVDGGAGISIPDVNITIKDSTVRTIDIS